MEEEQDKLKENVLKNTIEQVITGTAKLSIQDLRKLRTTKVAEMETLKAIIAFKESLEQNK